MGINQQIAVMQAFADGKEIEVRPVGVDDWVPALTPVWNWSCFEYRIKPDCRIEKGKKLRPYTYEELSNTLIEKGGYVKTKEESHIFIISQVLDDFKEGNKIQLSDWRQISYKQLLECCLWLDGSPCGVIEEE